MFSCHKYTAEGRKGHFNQLVFGISAEYWYVDWEGWQVPLGDDSPPLHQTVSAGQAQAVGLCALLSWGCSYCTYNYTAGKMLLTISSNFFRAWDVKWEGKQRICSVLYMLVGIFPNTHRRFTRCLQNTWSLPSVWWLSSSFVFSNSISSSCQISFTLTSTK